MGKKLLIILICILALTVIFFIKEKVKTNLVNSEVLKLTKTIYPNASWSREINKSIETPLGKASGVEISTSITSNETMLEHKENNGMAKMGYKINNNLAADGAGSSQWGYTKGNDIAIYNYKTTPTNNNPNEPLEFNCPCEITLDVFFGKLDNSKINNSEMLANPASVYCEKVGGSNVIKNGPNGQYGLCEFGDNMACEEWALYKGDCPVGGVKTTGFNNIEQMYCAWIGGQTLAVPNANCTLPNGTVCPAHSVYYGTCGN